MVKRRKSLCYCINLRRGANAVSQLYDERLAAVGVTVNQFALLNGIARMEPCSVSALAEDVGLERTTLVRTLHPLLDRELVRDTAEAGRRSRRLELTEAGRDLIRQGLGPWTTAQAEVERRIGRDGLATLLNLLGQLEDPEP